MQRLALILSLAATLVASVSTERGVASVTPVQKVIQLLDGLVTKGREEKHQEQLQFAAFEQFCSDVTAEKERLISIAKDEIEALEADIQKYADEVDQLTEGIQNHETDIETWSEELDAATKVRKSEKKDFDDLHQDYSESIYALERAISELKTQDHDTAQAPAALAQVAASELVPAKERQAIEAFLAQGEAEEPMGPFDAPEGAAYEFQSGSIVEMLEKLLDKFKLERRTVEEEEDKAAHSFDLLRQELTDQTDAAKRAKSQKEIAKPKVLLAKTTAESDEQETTATKQGDEKYLADLNGTCQQKSSEFDSRQKLREEEISTLLQAIEIISGDAVQGNADEHLPSFLAKGHGAVALVQQLAEGRSPSEQRVEDFLRLEAKKLDSRVLSALVSKVEADPFAKVKKLITELIYRLMEEATEEAKHKGWCDSELAQNEHTRKEKSEAVETLTAEIDELKAMTAQLANQIADLSADIEQLDYDMGNATKLRNEEKAKNNATVVDAQEAQAAVKQAIDVLKDFYKKAGEATALVQHRRQEPANADEASAQPKAPEIFDTPYKGMQAEKGGIVGMMEVIQSDFQRLESDTTAAEEAATNEYNQFMTDSKVNRAEMSKDLHYKTQRNKDGKQALTVKGEDLEENQKTLDLALGEYEKLKPACMAPAMSYEERVARREQEIEALKEALKILEGALPA